MQRKAIQQLPTSLVNRIAAGEVIERPASVVKELVENSIDAGAHNIIVEIADGGRELIRVTDDGGGIPADELRLAFAEHATSKLACDDDLFRIGTMGFRGEALASIGAVSQARMLSRTADSHAAYEIFNRGGEVSDPQQAAGNVGTSVEVRNLFFNVPARRKFLKGSSTESGHVSDILLRIALPHPAVSFKLISAGRTTLNLPAATFEERLLSAWPDEFREQRLPLEVRDAEIRIRGLIGLPEIANPTARHQYFYLNGRHIRDKFIQHAVKESYRGLTEPGRQPAAILLIQIPTEDVDVNVHPTKVEVRFRDSGRIHGLILSGVREKLLGADLTPRAVAQPAIPDEQRQDVRSRLAEFFKKEYASPSVGGVADPASSSVVAHPVPQESRPLGLIAPHAASARPPTDFNPTTIDNRTTPAATDYRPRTTDSPQSPIANHKSQIENAIQLHNTYLVAETDEGMIIIDQHALHERIMYEELKTRLGRGNLESQRLLIPDVIPASARQLALLEQIQPLLARLGIEAAPFGPESIAIQSFPTFLDKLNPGRFVGELLERGEHEQLDLHDEELLHEVLDMMACKAAVKAGDPLTPPEIQALLARRELVERSSNCPHGRPTTLRLTLRDLEKQFKRTGF